MSTFVKGGSTGTPFGRNEFLRSTRDVKFESYTFAAATLPAVTIDGVSGQKILQPGLAIAKITSGVDIGKVGPYQTTMTDGRQLAANIVGINSTFLPWQLIERDCEVAVVYEATVVLAWCFELAAGGAYQALGATAANAMKANSVEGAANGVSINFK